MFRPRCDTCGFEFTTDNEADAYGTARNHQATDSAQLVLIERQE